MDAHPGCDGVTKFTEKPIRSSITAPQQLMHISTGQVITLHPYVEKLSNNDLSIISESRIL